MNMMRKALIFTIQLWQQLQKNETSQISLIYLAKLQQAVSKFQWIP